MPNFNCFNDTKSGMLQQHGALETIIKNQEVLHMQFANSCIFYRRRHKGDRNVSVVNNIQETDKIMETVLTGAGLY